MAPKTPKRKRGKMSTSFRKNKITPVHSGKKFKQTKKMQKKMRKSVCDSSFNLSCLSQSAVSTPVGSMRGVVGKRKAAPVNLGEESVLISGAGNDVVGDDTKEVMEPQAKKARVNPPENDVVVKDISDMFRNEHVVSAGMIKPSSSQTVMAENDKIGEIIVIDDDEEDDTVTPVEELGQEMLKLVEDEVPEVMTAVGQAVPDTPRTVIKKLETGQDNHNDTIVLDDTADDDDLEIVENDDWPPLPTPLQPRNMQEVISRYPGKAADFIPLGGEGRRGKGRGRRRRGREELGGGGEQLKRMGGRGGRPLFTVGGPMTEFSGGSSSVQPRVFRFTGTGPGNREEQGKVVSQGPTMYVGEQDNTVSGGLRPIVIDGSNVAMSHGMNTVFSSRGIELVVKYFSARGHQKIVAFVPQFRNKPNQSTDRELLEQLHKSGNLVYTPSREVGNTRITSYDDTFILDYAAMHGGVVITRDNYRDLAREKAAWLEVVQKRILMPTFVGDDLMFPHDPLGRNGPTLDRFLKF